MHTNRSYVDLLPTHLLILISYVDLLPVRLLLLSSYVDLLPTRYHLVHYLHLSKRRSVVLPQEWDSNLGPLLVLL